MCIATSISNKFVSFRRRFHIEETHFSVHSCSKKNSYQDDLCADVCTIFRFFDPPTLAHANPLPVDRLRFENVKNIFKYRHSICLVLCVWFLQLGCWRFFIFLVIWQMSVQMPVSMGSRHQKGRVIHSPKSILLPEWRCLCVNHMIINDCLWPHFSNNLRCFE